MPYILKPGQELHLDGGCFELTILLITGVVLLIPAAYFLYYVFWKVAVKGVFWRVGVKGLLVGLGWRFLVKGVAVSFLSTGFERVHIIRGFLMTRAMDLCATSFRKTTPEM